MGIFAGDPEDEFEPSKESSRTAVWGQYLAWHARRQLAFGTLDCSYTYDLHPNASHLSDMWWLGMNSWDIAEPCERITESPI